MAEAEESTSSKGNVGIIHTGPAMPQMLLGEGPQHAGGAELQIALIARGLRLRGWDVTCGLRDWPESDVDATPEGIRIARLKAKPGGLPVLRFFTNTLPANLRLLREVDADVYLMMGIGWQQGLVAQACRRADRRLVLWLASTPQAMGDCSERVTRPLYTRWLTKYGLQHATVLVAQTSEQQRLLQQYQGRDSVLIRNIWPVDKADHAPPADPPEVLWAATVRDLKRPHLFLDVAAALPDIRFVMAGGSAVENPRLYPEVEARAAKMPNVEFLGFVPFNEIDKYYARASAYLCTSTLEGFPNTFLQTWSHGRPVVSTVDPDGVIRDHNLGFHGNSLDELVEAVRLACETSSDYAQRARDYLREFHSPEVIMSQIEEVLSGT